MSITVEALQKQGVTASSFDATIREQLARIDVKIRETPRVFGVNRINFELPTFFASMGAVSKKDQQLFIYSHIVKNLKSRGFDVKIVLDMDRTTLIVSYTLDFNQDELKAMEAILKDANLNPAEVEALAPAPARRPKK